MDGIMKKRGLDKRVGFTLIETIAVLVVIGILTFIVMAAADTTDNNLVAQTHLLQQNIRYAQTMAMKEAEPWGITSAGGTGSYSLFRGDPSSGTTAENFPGQGSSVSLTNEDVRLTSAISLYFDGYGRPYHGNGALFSGNTTDAANTIVVTKTGGGGSITSRTFYITPETGLIVE